MAKREKMSKSRGNVVTVDEVVYGVYEVASGYEFRNALGEIIDYKFWGIWQDKSGTGDFYTSTRTGKQPAFLCEVDGDPCVLLINGEERSQHSDEEMWFVGYVGSLKEEQDDDETTEV